jgi:gamma-glutamyltranspeptidase/glutathione hydrolase/leukotriene-C4 hydrolase
MLEKGGDAMDGAIAALLCLGIVNPHSMGIGGGFVMTVYNETSRKAETLIARETAPMAASPNMTADHPDRSFKGRSSLLWGKK